jgi:precorrin-6B methylase 2
MKHPALRLKDWWRVPRLTWHLLTRPTDFPRYIAQSLPSRLTPLDLGMPWWSFAAVDAVSNFIKPEMEVFEFGSGGSSIFLAERSKHVTCVEDSEDWTELVRGQMDRQGVRNLKVLARPFDFQKAEKFGESSYLAALGEGAYDIIVVDGQEESVQVRPECFWRAERHVKPGGLIVLDDSWRYPQVKAQNRAKRWKDYKGVGCCRRGVTSTCLFFY